MANIFKNNSCFGQYFASLIKMSIPVFVCFFVTCSTGHSGTVMEEEDYQLNISFHQTIKQLQRKIFFYLQEM